MVKRPPFLFITIFPLLLINCSDPARGKVVLDNLDDFNRLVALLQTTGKFDRFTFFLRSRIVAGTVEYPSLEDFYSREKIPDELKQIPSLMKKFKIMGIEKGSNSYFFITGGFWPSGEYGYLFMDSKSPVSNDVKVSMRTRLTDNWYTFAGHQ